MARPQAPCGTISAAKRHRRKHEPMDEPCRQAERDEKNQRRVRARQQAAETAREALDASVRADEPVDRDTILRESLEVLRAHLLVSPPQSVASIARAIRDTVEALTNPQHVWPAEDDHVLSDIARAYAQRAAGGSERPRA